MPEAKKEDVVKVNYTGKLGDGSIFDSSEKKEPLEFKLGAGQVIPGFEDAVLGMEEGAKKTVTFPSDKAYGPHRDELVMEVSKTKLPDNLKPEVGQALTVQLSNDQQAMVVVTKVTDEDITIDANHPLAGRDLTFDIELITINP